MTRLRASMARSDADRDLHRQVAEATRYVAKAQDVCLRMARSRDPAMQTEAHRARATQQTLQQVRSLLDRVGYFTPGYDRSDPDLIPEATKRAETRQQRTEQKRQAEAKRVSPEQRIREALEKMRDEDGPE